jgi:nucleotide-binding universal stress UspA family protein
MKKILVAVDFSKGTGPLVQQAAELGKELGAAVWVVHATSDALQAAYVSSPFVDFSSEYVAAPGGDVETVRELCAQEYKREHESLLHISARLREEGLDAQALLLKGDAAELILKKAGELDADIIMMGSHGHGMLRKMLVGSVTEAVLRKAPCNVLIVPFEKSVPLL